ncbi:MAG TPA: hypothetical protein VNT26_13315, partial [Candidatus Sulfotelmatobacter sp.]|nr:hypothetical protein [Candidatus Sulfotelmatobacter sp.]
MKSRITTLCCALGLVGLISLPCQAAQVETPGLLKFDVWFPPLRDPTFTGPDLFWMYYDPNFNANTPDLTSYTAGCDSRGAFPDNGHEQYGARLSGWITPRVTDDYHFYLASDDSSQLWISTDA